MNQAVDRACPDWVRAIPYKAPAVMGQFQAKENDTRQLTSEANAVRLLDALREGAPPAVRQRDGTELLG